MKSFKALLGYTIGFILSTGIMMSLLNGYLSTRIHFESYESEMFTATMLFVVSTFTLLAMASELRKVIGK